MGQFILLIMYVLFQCSCLAAAIAAILNLPLTGSARFLILLAGVLFILMLKMIADALIKFGRIEYFIRLIYVTVHLHNEKYGIMAAKDRLKEDIEFESDRDYIYPEAKSNIYTMVIVVFIAITAAIIHFGVFGDVGKGWADGMHFPR